MGMNTTMGTIASAAPWISKLAREASSLTGLLVIVTVLVGFASWLCGDPVLDFIAAYLLAWISLLVRAFYPQPPVHWPPQWSLRRMFVAITSVSVLTATFADQAPFRLRFALSRASLERLADQIESGDSIDLPRRSGLFMVYWADSRDGRYIRLSIDRATGEFLGFVRRQSARQPRYKGNEWYSMALDERWQYFDED